MDYFLGSITFSSLCVVDRHRGSGLIYVFWEVVVFMKVLGNLWSIQQECPTSAKMILYLICLPKQGWWDTNIKSLDLPSRTEHKHLSQRFLHMAAMEWLDQLWLGLVPHTQEQPMLFIVLYGSEEVCFSHMQSNHMNLTHVSLLCFFFFLKS